ncbi:MAG: hydrolase, partial [Synergistaceae bacterium]|nr:hydrolase [Synergistaceae bacterium]
DIDWETTQSVEGGHPVKGGEMLRERGYEEEIIRAELAHGWEFSGVEPKSRMEKTLYAIDELTGLVTAVALVRPGKSLSDLETKSVKKKWKDKTFARGVNREVIEKGVELMGEPLEWLIENTIEALKPVEREIGLGTAD